MKKKIVVLVMGLSMVLIAAGCTKKDPISGVEGTTATASESKDQVEPANYEEYVKIGEYTGIPAPIEVVLVEDQEVEAAIDNALQSAGKVVEIMDRAVADGDSVNIDYKGLLDGVAFDGGTAEGQSLTIGSKSFIEGFEEGLVGANPGDSIELPLSFPAEYNSPELAGKDVVFEVKVNYINGELVIPELDDVFVQENTTYSTVEEYRTGLKNELFEKETAEALQYREQQLVAGVMANATISGYPEVRLQEEIDDVKSYYNEYASYMGTDFAGLAQAFGMTEEGFNSQIEDVAKESLGKFMVFTLIAKKEGITLAEEDYTAGGLKYGFQTKEEFIETYGETLTEEILITDKVIKMVIEKSIDAPAVAVESTDASSEETTAATK